MTLDELQNAWEADAYVDASKLDSESLKTFTLHSKYFKWYSRERLILKKLREDMKKLDALKYDFLTQGPTKQQHEMGWKLPTRGKILKPEVPRYMAADEDISKLTLRIAYQQEKVDFLSSVIDQINKRGYQLKNAIEFIKWCQGS